MEEKFQSILKTEYQHREYVNPAAKEAIRQDLERASDKYAVSESGTAFRKGDETQEDNDTSAQPQTQAMGAALREPQRDEMSMR